MLNGRVAIVILVLTAIGTFIYQSYSPEGGNKSSTFKEEVLCLSAVCVADDKLGTDCVEFQPNVSRIVLSADPNSTKAYRLTVENNAYECR
jgi:hypothetical protein